MGSRLDEVATTVVRRAERQGYVVPRDIRSELTRAGLPEAEWQAVAALARPELNYRQGRYYHIGAVSPRLRQEQDQQHSIQRAVRRLVKAHRAGEAGPERRQDDRTDFIQPVTVETEDGRRFTLLSRDLSPTGIRLVGTRRLLGHKIRVHFPTADDGEPIVFLVRVLWTCAIGDDLFENGGTFVEVVSNDAAQGSKRVNTPN